MASQPPPPQPHQPPQPQQATRLPFSGGQQQQQQPRLPPPGSQQSQTFHSQPYPNGNSSLPPYPRYPEGPPSSAQDHGNHGMASHPQSQPHPQTHHQPQHGQHGQHGQHAAGEARPRDAATPATPATPVTPVTSMAPPVPASAATSTSTPAPGPPLPLPAGPQPIVYLATYSNVPVYEITIRGIAVMRRRADGYLNATQILKVAGVEKAKRTKILEKEILTGEHEKVQGGYGKYQGTWIPNTRAQELAAKYNVAHLLRPVLEFDPRTAAQVPTAGPKRRPANPTPAKAGAAAPNSQHRDASPAGAKDREASPFKVPTQQPRFLQLRAPPSSTEGAAGDVSPSSSGAPTGTASGYMPATSANLIGALSSGGTPGANRATSQGIPPGSSTSLRQALTNYSQYGYTPQGVPLPPPADVAAGSKRSGPDAGDESMEDAAGPSKRARATSPAAATTSSPPRPNRSADDSMAFAIGPSPVKDLSLLAGPDSSLRGASHPRGQRIQLGPPDELARRAGNARFADRPVPLKVNDQGEKRMRDHLVALFTQEGAEAEEGAGAASTTSPSSSSSSSVPPAARLKELLSELRAAASLGAEQSDDGATASLPCIDTLVDDHGHTALHWAAALCRMSLVKTLVARPPSEGGANIQAGNYCGETALHRTVLVTNAYDSSLFPDLLHLLAPSLHTRDFKSRTVLHHIALVAFLRGRGTPARYYLACVLDYIAKFEGGRFASLVDAQDEDGETALGIAARLGNNSMVRMLLEVGARKDLANCFGLKPSDWIDIDDDEAAAAGSSSAGAGAAGGGASGLTAQTRQGLKEGRSDVVAALMRPPQAPIQKSQDVLDQMRSTLDDLSGTFGRELGEKTDALQTTQSHLQGATRELTARRRSVVDVQARIAQLEERKITVRNLRRRIHKMFGGAGGAEHGAEAGPQGEKSQPHAHDGQVHTPTKRPQDESASGSGSGSASAQQQQQQEESASPALIAELLSYHRLHASLPDPPLQDADAPSDSHSALIAQRFLLQWYTSRLPLLSSDIAALSAESARTEAQCRKVVALSSKIDEGKVEAILDELVAAVESYSEVDLARVAAFLARTSAGAGGAAGPEKGKEKEKGRTQTQPQATSGSGTAQAGTAAGAEPTPGGGTTAPPQPQERPEAGAAGAKDGDGDVQMGEGSAGRAASPAGAGAGAAAGTSTGTGAGTGAGTGTEVRGEETQMRTQ